MEKKQSTTDFTNELQTPDIAQSQHQSTQLGKSAHPADAGISGRDSNGLRQIVHHGVPVIGAQRDLPIGATFRTAAVLFIKKISHDGRHVHRACQEVRFVE